MQAEGMQLLAQPKVWRDDFHGSTLQLGWYHLRTPLKKDYSLSERPGYLSLYGNAYRIDDSECPSMLLQKQTGFSGDWRVKLNFAPTEAGHEVGTAIWWSQFAYASIGLRKPFDEDKSGLEIVSRCYDETDDQFKVCLMKLNLKCLYASSLTRWIRNLHTNYLSVVATLNLSSVPTLHDTSSSSQYSRANNLLLPSLSSWVKFPARH
jgi:beta-xylosidase